MQRIVNLFSLISLIILLIIYFVPIKLDSERIAEEVISNNEKISQMGLDQSKLLHHQMDIIIRENLNFLGEFIEEYFVPESDNPYLYYSPWNPNLIYDKNSSINTSAYLFIDSDEVYHVMYNYEHELDSNCNNYISLDFSKNYNLQLINHKIYLDYKGNEYYQDIGYNVDFMTNTFELPSPKFSQYFKYPTVKGFYHFKFQPKEGYTSNMFSLDINTFDSYQEDNSNVLLGFNSFRSNPKTIQKFIPTRLSFIYKEEN